MFYKMLTPIVHFSPLISLPICCVLHQLISHFTTRTPAVTDVFDSGRNVGALRPGRRVGFRSLWRGPADGIS